MVPCSPRRSLLPHVHKKHCFRQQKWELPSLSQRDRHSRCSGMSVQISPLAHRKSSKMEPSSLIYSAELCFTNTSYQPNMFYPRSTPCVPLVFTGLTIPSSASMSTPTRPVLATGIAHRSHHR